MEQTLCDLLFTDSPLLRNDVPERRDHARVALGLELLARLDDIEGVEELRVSVEREKTPRREAGRVKRTSRVMADVRD